MIRRRYLGLDLLGAKNAKTTLAVIEFFPKERKLFLLDVHSGIGGSDDDSSADAELIETIKDHCEGQSDAVLGVNAALTLPPCVECTRKTCPLPESCTVPEIKWMRQWQEKHHLKNFTPYTQRPVELWLKTEILKKVPEKLRFDIDETLGGNRAPLTMRMHFLKRHLHQLTLVEALPKVSLAVLSERLKLSTRMMSRYRQLEDGAWARQEILDRLAQTFDLFIYDRDLKKLTLSLNAFDAFITAVTALLFDQDETKSAPKGFPVKSGWVAIPQLPTKNRDTP